RRRSSGLLLLQEGDWILSDGGNFEKVTADWFFNGNGNSPYWFAGGWPSIYNSENCISYCVAAHSEDLECIYIQLPPLTIEEGITDNVEGCITVCLAESPHCGITIKQDEIGDWTGSCPQTRGIDSWVTQTCWAVTPNYCAEDGQSPCEELSADIGRASCRERV